MYNILWQNVCQNIRVKLAQSDIEAEAEAEEREHANLRAVIVTAPELVQIIMTLTIAFIIQECQNCFLINVY